MMKIYSSVVSRIVQVRAESGEDLLLALRQGVTEAGIRSGVFVGGAGSLASYHFHVVRTTNLPPGNTFIEGVGAFDILTVTGAIADGKVHPTSPSRRLTLPWAATWKKAARC